MIAERKCEAPKETAGSAALVACFAPRVVASLRPAPQSHSTTAGARTHEREGAGGARVTVREMPEEAMLNWDANGEV